MGFWVKYRGLQVMCETLADIDALADRLEQKVTGSINAQLEQRDVVTDDDASQNDKIKSLLKNLKPDQKRVLAALAMASSPVTDSKLREQLKISGDRALAGLMSGITKRSKPLGIRDLVLKNSKRNGTGERRYEYSLKRKWIPVFRETLAKSEAGNESR